jgi:hypothetical protein
MVDRRTLLGSSIGSVVSLSSDEVGWLNSAHDLVGARDWVGKSTSEAFGKAALLVDLSYTSIGLWDWGCHDEGSEPEGNNSGESHLGGSKESGLVE